MKDYLKTIKIDRKIDKENPAYIKKMIRAISFSLLVLVFVGCSSSSIDLGTFSSYFPETELLESGVVNKYYEHFEPGENRNPY